MPTTTTPIWTNDEPSAYEPRMQALSNAIIAHPDLPEYMRPFVGVWQTGGGILCVGVTLSEQAAGEEAGEKARYIMVSDPVEFEGHLVNGEVEIGLYNDAAFKTATEPDDYDTEGQMMVLWTRNRPTTEAEALQTIADAVIGFIRRVVL